MDLNFGFISLEPVANNTSGSWNLIDNVCGSISASHFEKSFLNSLYKSL